MARRSQGDLGRGSDCRTDCSASDLALYRFEIWCINEAYNSCLRERYGGRMHSKSHLATACSQTHRLSNAVLLHVDRTRRPAAAASFALQDCFTLSPSRAVPRSPAFHVYRLWSQGRNGRLSLSLRIVLRFFLFLGSSSLPPASPLSLLGPFFSPLFGLF